MAVMITRPSVERTDADHPSSSRFRSILIFVAEHLFLAMAFAMAIPPVMSNADQTPRLLPSIVLSVAPFVVSRLIARHKKQESLAGLVAKTTMWALTVCVFHLRVMGGP